MAEPSKPVAFKAVVVGCSAGGVAALQRLLGELPQDFHAPVLVVQHLAPDSANALASVLGQGCALTVKEATECEAIQAGTVYLAPSNYHLLVEMDATLSLSTDAPVSFSRPSIDVLFDSAARAFGTGLVAVILTGANHDGSQGMKRVKANGGVAIVQDPADAEAPRMPEAVLEAVAADHILPLDQIAGRLLYLLSPPEQNNSHA